jgi:hypothetical protein
MLQHPLELLLHVSSTSAAEHSAAKTSTENISERLDLVLRHACHFHRFSHYLFFRLRIVDDLAYRYLETLRSY